MYVKYLAHVQSVVVCIDVWIIILPEPIEADLEIASELLLSGQYVIVL